MRTRQFSAACAFVFLVCGSGLAAGLDPHTVAGHVDQSLTKESFGGASENADKPASRADDPTFLRRAYLDLIGHSPTAAQITAFSLDGTADKRAAAVDRLLADPRFGENWARYWRDVIFYRRSEDRALISAPAAVKFLSDSLNNDPHWDKIATKFITATGDVRDDGSTALIMAQMGVPEDTTAEISRIFMGIQIQCAQCHNHPTDRWKREQFHELTAFMPRIAVRRVKDGEKNSFEIVSVNREGKNKKGDKPGRGHLEHHMPDLKHPEAEGKLMTPVFFATGQKLEVGTPDAKRRAKLAEWITSRGDRWFAKAFVNRMWSELVGRGFYEPVDDIGPDRKCSAPRTLDYLSEEFASSHYDVKWLMRVITSTEAYQRQSRSRYEEPASPFAASCPQRLRGDQLFNTLAGVLEINEEIRPAGGKRENLRPELAGPRAAMNLTFGYDPSERRDEVAGSIPQALLLMNGPAINRAMSGRVPATALGRILSEIKDDSGVVEELYLRTLGREATADEAKTCLDHVKSVGNRTDAFEDILWALVNSTEFLNRK
jgi:hypothetical protein